DIMGGVLVRLGVRSEKLLLRRDRQLRDLGLRCSAQHHVRRRHRARRSRCAGHDGRIDAERRHLRRIRFPARWTDDFALARVFLYRRDHRRVHRERCRGTRLDLRRAEVLVAHRQPRVAYDIRVEHIVGRAVAARSHRLRTRVRGRRRCVQRALRRRPEREQHSADSRRNRQPRPFLLAARGRFLGAACPRTFWLCRVSAPRELRVRKLRGREYRAAAAEKLLGFSPHSFATQAERLVSSDDARSAMTTRTRSAFPARWALVLVTGFSVVASAAPSEAENAAATQGLVKRSDLEIVDCLLPGQVRQLGNTSFLTQRRPIRTTVAECSIRGGEYVAYDRADLKSALRIWMQAAESGDVEAQTKVGEIYERGLGVEPNYEAAALWYQKAADRGYARALFNLGTLYEQGLGVPQDRLKALNLYREAWGVPEDSLIFASAAEREQQALREELEAAIAEKDAQLGLLRKQLETLQRELDERAAAEQARRTEPNAEVEALKRWIAQLEGERRRSTERLAGLPRTRTPQGEELLTPLPPMADERTVAGLNFGRFYAIVIGNQHYQSLEDLATPRYDAARAARI